MLPDDISTLVQKVYSAQNTTDEYKKYADDIKEREHRAKSFLLEKNKGKDIHGLLARDMKDSQAEASVRDGISSVEALVLMKDRHGNIRFLPWRGSGIIPADRCPDEDICRHRLCVRVIISKIP